MSFRFAGIVRLATLLPLVLAACATSNTVCRTELTLTERHHLILAPVAIDGATVPGILDTGAQVSAVTVGLVDRLGLLGDDRNGTLIGGVGGQGTPQNDVLLDSFAFAGFDPDTRHYPVIALPSSLAAGGPGAAPIGALIGADVISHFDVDLDVAGGRAILYDAARCQVAVPDWHGPFAQVPLDETWTTGRLLLPVKLDGQAFRALLDSGATNSVLDLSAAEKLGLSAEMLAQAPGGEGFGAAGVNFREVLHQFHALEIGGERYRDPRISVLDRSLRETDMLLGLDWLRRHRVWISYRRHMLFIARPAG